jgi:hypothetical protein
MANWTFLTSRTWTLLRIAHDREVRLQLVQQGEGPVLSGLIEATRHSPGSGPSF